MTGRELFSEGANLLLSAASHRSRDTRDLPPFAQQGSPFAKAIPRERLQSDQQNLNQSRSAVTTSETRSIKGNVALDQQLPTGTHITLNGNTEIDKSSDNGVELAGTRPA